ncbi:MAG: DUF4173 domain-containing protein [Sphingomonadaceae bacterium]|nr:DUF4173 domain-containing protein [Sphingomonadaceae bacterium]
MTMRYTFLLKLAGALLLVALADLLFWFQLVGSTLGLFALAVLTVLLCIRVEILARWPSRIAAGTALVFALALAVDPGPLALLLFTLAITLAALLPRTMGFDDGRRWALRLIIHGLMSVVGPFRDLMLTGRARRRRPALGLRGKALTLLLPLAGSILFLALFAQANPLIGDALARIELWPDLDALTVVRIVYWALVFTAMWSLLRPSRFALWRAVAPATGEIALPGVTPGSVTLSLLAFNLIFALQNGLDLAFLWSGAALPAGMSFAEYAHRGAYPLIATALLAGLFVLVTLRPGTATAASRPIRLLVTLWTLQNVLLVASTMLRTVDYIQAYSLTELRIAALIWMGLVALGLVLICVRLLRAKSGAWLVNANLLAAGIVLGACCWLDLGAIAAGWNVRHARDVGGTGAALDLCYLHQLGPAALPALVSLEARPLPRELRDRVQWVRSRMMAQLARSQSDWHGWTLQGARRLAAAEAAAAALRLPVRRDEDRECDGRPTPPPPPIASRDDAPVNEAPAIATVAPEAVPPVPPPAPAPARPRPLTARPAR